MQDLKETKEERCVLFQLYRIRLHHGTDTSDSAFGPVHNQSPFIGDELPYTRAELVYDRLFLMCSHTGTLIWHFSCVFVF